MATTDVRSIVLFVAAAALILGAIYLVNPSLLSVFGVKENFEATMDADPNYKRKAGQEDQSGEEQEDAVESNPNSAGGNTTSANPSISGFANAIGGFKDASGEGFANLEDVTGPAEFGSSAGPAGCYPRDQLTPSELLPKDPNSVWAQQNPMGTGSLKGKNFLSAGALIGVNTVGQSLRNANLQLRSEPPNPQVPVSVFNNSTIEPDTNRRDLEIE
jgi:hypothetical protein